MMYYMIIDRAALVSNIQYLVSSIQKGEVQMEKRKRFNVGKRTALKIASVLLCISLALTVVFNPMDDVSRWVRQNVLAKVDNEACEYSDNMNGGGRRPC